LAGGCSRRGEARCLAPISSSPGPCFFAANPRVIDESASLFGGFIGTTARSDSSPAYTSGVRRSAFPDRSRTGNTEEVSRFSCMQFLSVPVVYDYAGPPAGSRYRRRVCALPLQVTGSASRIRFSQLHPLPTDISVYASTAASRLPPQDSRRGGSPLLSCKTLSFSTACRLIPAH